MKKAIFTIMMAFNPGDRYVKRVFAAYAERTGSELVICTRPYYQRLPGVTYNMHNLATMQKRYGQELLKKFDRVLYLDSDILITPHAPDIFETYPDLDLLYMFNEGRYIDPARHVLNDRAIQGDMRLVSELLGGIAEWPKHEGRAVYFNAGVMLYSRGCRLFDFFRTDELVKIHDRLRHFDQTYTNYIINRYEIPTGFLSPMFNRTSILGDEWRLEGYFIHYAGGGYAPRKKFRYRTIARDYHALYGVPETVADSLRQYTRYLVNEVWRAKHDTLRQISLKRAQRRLGV